MPGNSGNKLGPWTIIGICLAIFFTMFVYFKIITRPQAKPIDGTVISYFEDLSGKRFICLGDSDLSMDERSGKVTWETNYPNLNLETLFGKETIEFKDKYSLLPDPASISLDFSQFVITQKDKTNQVMAASVRMVITANDTREYSIKVSEQNMLVLQGVLGTMIDAETLVASGSAKVDSIEIKSIVINQLPYYRIKDNIIDLADGSGRFADIIIPSFSPKMSPRKIGETLGLIAIKERLDVISAYCTNTAFLADYSSDYRDAHPEALETGYLGRLNHNRFTPSAYMQ